MASNAFGGIPCSLSAEFRAYDRLPRKIRKALQDACFKWSAEDTLDFRRRYGIENTLKRIAWAEADRAHQYPIFGEVE